MSAGTMTLPNGTAVSSLGPRDSLNVYHDIFEDRCYARHGIAFRDGDTVLDVGANTGLFVLWLNTLGHRSRVFALEPVPAIFQVMERNLRLHDRLGAVPVNVGLSDRDGTVEFTYYPNFSNASTMHPDHSARTADEARAYVESQAHTLPAPLPWLISLCPAWLKWLICEAIRRYHLKTKRVKAEVRTLSTFLRERGLERIDLLKIDAERSEGRILAGIEEADWPRIRQAVVEVHDGEEATARIERLLASKGFRVVAEPNPAMPGLALVYAVR
ncbi:MAG: FkbM family methyltransferase [Gemmataceae bacterium]|nr:FkbM family methyltransferase [Gemmataceae bacterium]